MASDVDAEHDGLGRVAARRRRMTRLAILSVVAGVLLAVASVPVGTVVRMVRESQSRNLPSWPLEQRSAFVMVYWERDATGARADRVFTLIEGVKMQVDPNSMAHAGVPAAVRGELGSRYAGNNVYWAGFPFTAAVGWREWPYATGELPPGSGPASGGPPRGVWLLHKSRPSSAIVWAVPLRPLWPGLLGNVAVYAAGAFVLLGLPGWWRRYVRRWEGRCDGCGYELGNSGRCPECGLEA